MVRALCLVILVACGRAKPPPVVPLETTISAETAEAAYDAKNWPECAAQWTTVAGRVTGELRSGALYDAACCYALDGRVDASLAALEAALDAGYWDADHLLVDADLAAVRGDPRWPGIAARVKTNYEAFAKTIVAPELRIELLALAAKIPDADDETLAATTARMKEVVAEHGWPGKRIVGVDGANAAWLLVHHANADVAFQKACVAKMEPLVAAGEVTGKDYAFLFDRVAIAEGRPQRYGTQFDGDDIAPLEDPRHVDERRRSVGLGTLAEYKALVKRAEQK